jgi:hypothetical protein
VVLNDLTSENIQEQNLHSQSLKLNTISLEKLFTTHHLVYQQEEITQQQQVVTTLEEHI